MFLTGNVDKLLATNKNFLIFYPEEAHMPALAVDKPSKVKKAIFKILKQIYMKNKTNLEIRNMFEKISEKYDFMNRIISFGLNEYVKTQAIKALNIKPNSKVLDLCCGSGDLGKIIKKIRN